MKKNLLAAERRKQLTEMVRSSGSVRIGEIAEFFGVSSETIRKDLIYLNDRGAVKKSFGGAVAVSEYRERPVSGRSMENAGQKAAIALRALDFLSDGGVGFIDSGSTALEVAKLLHSGMDVALVTNSLAALNALTGKGLDLHFVGGVFSDVTMATSGFWATNAVSTIKFDVALLGTSGFQSHSGPSVKTFPDAQMKQDVLKNSRKKIVLADSSKFVTNAVVQYAEWRDIDVLITDGGAPREAAEAVGEAAEVIFA